MQQLKLRARQILAQLLYSTGALKRLQKPPHWRILMYHRITSPAICGHAVQPGMFVEPETFAMQMQFLATHHIVRPLDELVQDILQDKPIERNTVAITFDDGWKDNYDYAFPILKRHSLPATIFLATRFIDSNETFWSDSIPQSLSSLRNSAAGKTSLQEAINKLPAASAPLLRSVSESLLADEPRFTDAVDGFVNNAKSLPEAERSALTQQLAAAAPRQSTRVFLSWDECREMSKAKISFGSHTHEHVPLDSLGPEAALLDLTRSYEMLKANRVSLSQVFCYPEGRYSPETQTVLSGFSPLAALSVERVSRFDTVPATLGRVGIHDDISSSRSLFAVRVAR